MATETFFCLHFAGGWLYSYHSPITYHQSIVEENEYCLVSAIYNNDEYLDTEKKCRS